MRFIFSVFFIAVFAMAGVAQNNTIDISFNDGNDERQEALAGSLPLNSVELYTKDLVFLNNPARIKNLKKLTIKDIDYEDGADTLTLRSLPAIISSMDSLEYLQINFAFHFDWKNALPVIARLPALKTLEIEACNDCMIPELGMLHQISELRISASGTENIPGELFQLTNLHSLAMNFNMIRKIPDEISNLKQLEKIDFSDNKLNALPASFSQLSKLKEVNFEDNRFKSIPSVILKMNWLETISFADNGIRKIGAAFCTISALRSIDLSRNRIRELPDSIEKLKKLNHFDVSVNCLHTLPATLLCCDSLQEVFCADNHFRKTPDVLNFLIFSCEFHDPLRLQDSAKIFAQQHHIALETIHTRPKFFQDMETTHYDCYKVSPDEEMYVFFYDYNKSIDIDDWIPMHYRKNPVFQMAKQLNSNLYDIPILPFGYRQMKNLEKAILERDDIWIGTRHLVRPLKHCHKLKYLKMEDGWLHRLPKSVSKIKSLETLELNCPNMKSLPSWLARMPRLKKIIIHGDIEIPDAIKHSQIEIVQR